MVDVPSRRATNVQEASQPASCRHLFPSLVRPPVYRDQGISGSKGREGRPAFDALCKDASRRQFDLIAAWSVDRLGRSLQDLVSFLLELQSKRVDLYLHQQALDTSTPMGKAMFQLWGVFAELERSIIQERVKAGLEQARANGKILGRPRTDPSVEAKILKLAGQGMGKGRIARTLGIGVSVAQRVLAS